MSSVLGTLKENVAYFFILVGVIWIGVTALTGAYLLVWPVIACIVAGVLQKFFPEMRLTWPWSVSAALLGLMVGVDQLHAWFPYLTSPFSTIAGEAVGLFAALLVVHAVLLYVGWGRPAVAKSAPS